jgi:uncharacterized protein YgbK (DUF1537 family)
LLRVGPTLVRAFIGLDVPAPMPKESLPAPVEGATPGGLIVVGSHVSLTTNQLTELKEAHSEIPSFVVDVPQVLDPATRGAHVDHLVVEVSAALTRGEAIIETSRTVTTGATAAASLDVARHVSDAVSEIVRRVVAVRPPRFVIAKGGITSSDVATEGLAIRRARVLGPMLDGIVSLWEPVGGPASGVPYIVFAGNVGGETSLREVVDRFRPTVPSATTTNQGKVK